MKSRGFTLTEVLVVMAILGVLAGIALPVTNSFVGKAREAACVKNLGGLGTALQMYLQEHNDKMPILVSGRSSKTEEGDFLETVLLPYVDSPDAFLCPADKVEFQRSGSSFMWNSSQNGLHVTKLSLWNIRDQPDKVPLIYEKEKWHRGGMNFVYGDMSASNKLRFAVGN